MKEIEIEIQVNIERINPLMKFLEKNAKFELKKHQIDEYFLPPHRNFIKSRPIEEWLRLRNSNGTYSITYKKWHFNKESKGNYCDEYETEIKDLNKLKKILEVLNFKSLVIVDKTRRTWIYKEYEINLDSVKALGDFVEIEYIGKESNVIPEKITEEMIKFLKKYNTT